MDNPRILSDFQPFCIERSRISLDEISIERASSPDAHPEIAGDGSWDAMDAYERFGSLMEPINEEATELLCDFCFSGIMLAIKEHRDIDDYIRLGAVEIGKTKIELGFYSPREDPNFQETRVYSTWFRIPITGTSGSMFIVGSKDEIRYRVVWQNGIVREVWERCASADPNRT